MSEQTKPANKPEDKPVDILEEFLQALVDDQWVDAPIKVAAAAGLLRYHPKPAPKKPEEVTEQSK